MKYSRQRELILETVMENPVHPTADTVYAMVREQEPNISLGTVYRNLNLLAEQGILRRIPMPAASDRFDGRTDSHHHMRCCGCGNLFDLPIAEFAGLEEQLKILRDSRSPATRFCLRGSVLHVLGNICRNKAVEISQKEVD